jgi:hypothetical protein
MEGTRELRYPTSMATSNPIDTVRNGEQTRLSADAVTTLDSCSARAQHGLVIDNLDILRTAFFPAKADAPIRNRILDKPVRMRIRSIGAHSLSAMRPPMQSLLTATERSATARPPRREFAVWEPDLGPPEAAVWKSAAKV